MTQIRLHNTLTGKVEPLEPRDPGKVAIYACGPTVYSRIHIGNARPYVLFMLLKRFLEHEGLETTFVANVTDINDKIYVAAREQGVSSDRLAKDMTAAYFADTDALGVGRPDHEPLATETLGPIIDLIEQLIDRRHAYVSGGDVYFSVPSFDRYGELSNRDVSSMEQGEEDNSLKHDPRDFALWKQRKPDEDTHWPSPWGEGRPGWHIECSAMAESLLGLEFDIHGGGVDLIFPHHENECAQTLAGRGKPLAKIWMHNGMIRFTGEKMSKSLGNILGLREAIERYGAPPLVMFFLSGHYRAPVECSEKTLAQAQANVERLTDFARRAKASSGENDPFAGVLESMRESFADDFNTPAAMAALFDGIREANRRLDNGDGVSLRTFATIARLIGLESVLEDSPAADQAAEELLRRREAARAAKDWTNADRLRDQLTALGWTIRDTPQGPELVPIA